jgi:hypothetical protein
VVPLNPSALQILRGLREETAAYMASHPHAKELVFVLRAARGKRQRAEAAETFELENFHRA